MTLNLWRYGQGKGKLCKANRRLNDGVNGSGSQNDVLM